MLIVVVTVVVVVGVVVDSSSNYYQTPTIVGSTLISWFYRMNINTFAVTNYYIVNTISTNYLFVRFLTTDTWGNVLVLILNINDGTYSSLAYPITPSQSFTRYIINMGETLSMSEFTASSGTLILPSLTPNYQIWNYQTYLDQINIAISTAFNGIKGTVGWPTQETPYLSYSDSKFSLNCGVGLASPVSIMSFNTRLWQRFIFNSKTNILNPNYEDIQILNLIPNIVPATTITNLMITQPNNSNFRWFDITRIIVRSTKMSVAGDVELTNTSLLNITDFAVDTSSPDVLLQIYEPTVLRYYQLYQTSPLNSIDVQLSYATRSGDIFAINLTAGSAVTITFYDRNYVSTTAPISTNTASYTLSVGTNQTDATQTTSLYSTTLLFNVLVFAEIQLFKMFLISANRKLKSYWSQSIKRISDCFPKFDCVTS